MGTYNRLRTLIQCPRCGVETEETVDCHFGDTSRMDDLKIGDLYPWAPRGTLGRTRPDDGDIDGEGYMECSHCRKDSFLQVIVRADRILRVEPDPTKPGYISD